MQDHKIEPSFHTARSVDTVTSPFLTNIDSGPTDFLHTKKNYWIILITRYVHSKLGYWSLHMLAFDKCMAASIM